MKCNCILIIALASLAMAMGVKFRTYEPPGGISKSIQGAFTLNKTLVNLTIAEFEKLNLNGFIANNKLNATLFDQYLIDLLPLLKPYLDEYVITYYPKLNTTVNVTLQVIQQLQTNYTAQTHAAAYLLFIDQHQNSQFVTSYSAASPTLTIDYSAVLKNAISADYLNTYVANKVQSMVKAGTMGPWGRFEVRDHKIWFYL